MPCYFPQMNPIERPHLLLTLCLIVSWVLPATYANAAQPPVYGTDIQPILAKHCVLCHGPDEAESGLRLDQFDSAVSALDSGHRAIVPTKPVDSELLRRVTTQDANTRMPPEGPSLSTDDVRLLERWINAGAKFDQHWAYRTVQKPELEPEPQQTSNQQWIRNPIDRYVLARLQSSGITPSPQADPATLAKRVAYDLTGLPLDPTSVNKFVGNPSEANYLELVESLLASEHFGERWGRHWLDKARYADSDGYEKDRPRPNAWLYRDWVIDSFNADMPFDQFTTEQLAGDLLQNPTARQKLATAFHRQTLTNTEGGVDKEEFRVEATFDRTETTAAIWLGLTMTCARCHNHKYDQISQQEYYRLFAFFNDLNETNMNLPPSQSAVTEHDRLMAEHQIKLTKIQSQIEAAKKKLTPEFELWMQRVDELTAKNPDETLAFKSAKPLSAKSTSGAVLTIDKNGSVLVTGPVPNKDKYTLVIAIPQGGLSGIRLEALTHDSLPSKGPGKPPNGNFVLSELRAYAGKDTAFKSDYEPVLFSYAEADFSQTKFAPIGAFQNTPKSGWAISPKMGQSHELLCLTEPLVQTDAQQFLQIVLDQQYGGKHVLGHFRLSTISGDTQLRRLPTEIARIFRIPSENRTKQQISALAEHFATQHAKTMAITKRLAALKSKAPILPTLSARVISPTHRTTKVLHRGDFLQPAEDVETDVLSVLSRTHQLTKRIPPQAADRLDLASWLTDPKHPLTARVSVNHVWAQLFGRGIVATVNDFGIRGDLPTHPRLLDWLAWNYPRNMKWSRKTLIKTIVLSSTYRQTSRHRSDLRNIDPTNQLLARQNRVRVSGEVVRDLHLAVSGLLSNKVGGPSVFPPLPAGVAELSYANNFKWNTSKGEDAYRRGMYTFFKRTSPYPNLISFDCPDSNTSRLQRDISNTPLQALVTLNNRVFVEASQALTQRVLDKGGETDHEKLSYAMQKVLVRHPSENEIQRFKDLLTSSREYYATNPEDAAKATSIHRSASHSIEENAAWVATLRMLTNLDEFIVRD